MYYKLRYIVVSSVLFCNGLLYAAEDLEDMSAEDRLARLERLLESQGLVDIIMRLDSLQNEVQQLRGSSEEQTHALEDIKKRQRDLYIDLDRRILQVERGGGAGTGQTAARSRMDSGTAKQDSRTRQSTGKPTGSMSASISAKQSSRGGTGKSLSKPSEQKAYQKAFDLLRGLQYNEATTAFRAFLADYPEGRYAHIAQYWLGEAGYAQRKYKTAISDYQKLIDVYPASPKIAEAMLKIGYSQYELKNYKASQKVLENLVSSHPGTTEAGQAQNLVRKIKLKHSKR